MTPKPPTLTDLKKHADRFGSEGVLETAIDLGYSRASLLGLLEYLERADLARIRQSRPLYRPPRVRTSLEERLDAAIARRRKEVPS